MARKDSEKDSERPHYYSQFWLDVAAGRRVIGAPKSNEEGDNETEAELEPELESTSLRRHGRSSETALSDGYEETIAHPEVEPDLETEDYVEPELDEVELENDLEDTEIPPMVVDEAEIPDVDLAPLEDEEVEDFFEEEEEDEDVGWGGARGRKKPKPGRQVKQPKKAKRERRGF